MAADLRSTRLRNFFFSVVDGKRAVKNSTDAKLFLSAVCAQEDRAQCVSILLSKRLALQALHKSFCSDLSDDCLNGLGAESVQKIANEDVRQMNNGQLLRDLLQSILVPPLMWEAYKEAAAKQRLTKQGLLAFGRLLLELMIGLPPTSDLQTSLQLKSNAHFILESHRLLESPEPDLRNLGYKIQAATTSFTTSNQHIGRLGYEPGGRHGNDFADFRQIAIFPTTDELLTEELPFILTADAVMSTEPEDRVAAHLDNQFRLLREDMLAEVREDLKRAAAPKSVKGKRRSTRLGSMQLWGIQTGTSPRLQPAAIALRCFDTCFKELPDDEDGRKKHIAGKKDFIKHGSFGCLMHGTDIVAFATIDRNEELLAKNPSIILLRVFGHAALRTALLTLKTRPAHEIHFLIIDTPYFAYEPILTCLQAMRSLPMSEHLLGLVEHESASDSPLGLDALAGKIMRYERHNLEHILNLPKKTTLDHSQTMSFVAGLTQHVSLIQGPPGTGKSFIGALLAKAFLDSTNETILVLCYTNHALDQFLEDIMDIGVSPELMIRLGSKSTARTKCLTTFEQNFTRRKESADKYRLRMSSFDQAEDSSQILESSGHRFSRWKCSSEDLLESLEFASEDMDFFHALSVPESSDGMATVSASGKAVTQEYLLDQWRKGKDAGVYKTTIGETYPDVWSMSKDQRAQTYARWIKDNTMEQVELVSDAAREYERDYFTWLEMKDEKVGLAMTGKRLIGCTTTAAAKYTAQISGTSPGIVLVEEAGEVLESHILTAMNRNTKQLVMIGDHLQLRPKVNNYSLTVEKGDGYDLNRSLFERLVVGGYPHTVLTKQHRMRPEISALVRRLMYPDLADSDTTLSRSDIRGLQSNVIFINHGNLETSDDKIKDRQDGSNSVSRQNQYEVEMVLKIVRYLAQQGYGTENQVVLTPYLGQLRLLNDSLKADHDPILSDLDSHDLIKAGLLTPGTATHNKRPLRISTVDNFQGEESDIVIASLTRSNKTGDIGFLIAPQRLNVLLSRARNGLVVIGNASTFRESKKGRAVWEPFFTQLVCAGQFFDGLPVKCEQHKDKQLTLKKPKDFDEHCPNGGCELPCHAMLRCGKHQCPEKCHRLVDHSKMRCKHIEESQCPKGHKIMWECWQVSRPCSTCERLQREKEARQERDLKLAKRRAEREKAYLEQLWDVEDLIDDQRRLVQEHSEDLDRARTLEQKKRDLVQAKKVAQQKQQGAALNQGKKTAATLGEKQSVPKKREQPIDSPAAAQWKHQKTSDNASNEHIDALMDMVGLELVKQQVLDVKDKIDTSLRQGTSLEKERFGVVLLGNPGTGKTTVARLYAKCLASMGAVAGSAVEETTASRLMSGGVPAFKKLIEKVLNAGGGGFFIDEAYQLATGSSASGSQILDTLLDEAENLVGKVVFILAGYNTEMESVFAHNPGLPSRFPHEMIFEDYTDGELLQILQKKIEDQFKGQMKVEGEGDGLLSRIVARRVGYGRGRPGFGNARAVENALAKIRSRQAGRLSKARRTKTPANDFLLTKEDMIGPEPSSALEGSKAWAELKSLIGLAEVKQAVDALMQSVRYNYERELREEARLDFNLNRVFVGSPGTGKTTVAKLYGKVLTDLGLLSNGQVVVKNPSDFVGDVLGASEKNTRGILASTVGKVLVIDEAYGLSGGSSSSLNSEDPYKTAVIDTLVAEIQSVPGEDRCVLLLGYQKQMEQMLQKVNPGLSRRFPLSEAFLFEDFSNEELRRIVELKLKQQAYTANEQAMDTMMSKLERARNKSNFGNAGEIDILLNTAKMRHQKRCNKPGSPHNSVLEAVDIDPDCDRVEKNVSSVRVLFEGTVGNDALIRRLEAIQKVARVMTDRKLNPKDQVPFNFIFSGPPGTGKTTTARKMGKIYYDMGMLESDKVIEISATDLIGQYVGQTGPKTQQQLENALGKVLFVDEAYRLAEGHFAKEAVDELVDRLTKTEFAERLIVILAGYDHDMERLMDANTGLRSRFPEFVNFQSLQPQDCLLLLISKLAKEPFLEASGLQAPQEAFVREATARLQTLVELSDWANARDIETLAKGIARERLYATDSTSDKLLAVTEQHVLTALDAMLSERRKRANNSHATANPLPSSLPLEQQFQDLLNVASPAKAAVATKTIVQDESEDEDGAVEKAPAASEAETRDAGVSDEVWTRLESDKQQAAARDQHYQETIAQQKSLEQEVQTEAPEEIETVKGASAEDPPDDLEERRRLEQARIAHRLAKRQREEELEKLRRERAALELERKKEQEAQRKLRVIGVCPVGYQWIKQASGYRCAAGGHYVSDQQLAHIR